MGCFCWISETNPHWKVKPNQKKKIVKGTMIPICVPAMLVISYSLIIPLSWHLFNRKLINYLFLYAAARILQAQPGTDKLSSQLNYTHPAPLSCLPLPWLHESTMCTWVFLHASLCFYTPYIWKRNHLFYVRLEMMPRHNWLCSCYQGNPADFDQRRYWKAKKISSTCWYMSVAMLSGNLNTNPSAVRTDKVSWGVSSNVKVKLNLSFSASSAQEPSIS